MAGDYFLQITGIEGESKVTGHEGQIDVEGWSWGEANPANPVTGGGGGTTTVNVTPLRINKSLDKSSVILMKYCAQLQQIDELVLTAVKAGGDEPLSYLTITMENAYITSFQAGGMTGGTPNDDMEVVAEVVRFSYDEQAAGGMGTGVVEFQFNYMTYEAS